MRVIMHTQLLHIYFKAQLCKSIPYNRKYLKYFYRTDNIFDISPETPESSVETVLIQTLVTKQTWLIKIGFAY